METIRSRQNPLVQQVRRLLERPRERQQAGLAVLDGDHLV
ncbi:MAG: RNA methyltransferase, partial [Betaproteobacteria bacterium]|nr:RNA methyltransferase [Betaproteobacteria bacterium]